MAAADSTPIPLSLTDAPAHQAPTIVTVGLLGSLFSAITLLAERDDAQAVIMDLACIGADIAQASVAALQEGAL